MKIIIAGGGKVGTSLVEVLSPDDDFDVTLIDLKEDVISSVENNNDVIGVLGNILSLDTLNEAEINNTNIFVATTDSDEVNILSCLIAKKKGAKHCVARVRSTDFANQLVFMREELGISLMINPDLIASNEIARALSYPTALKFEPFSKGHFDLVEFKISDDSMLANRSLIEISKKLKLNMLISAVQRDDDIYIPNGNFIIMPNDKIHVTAPHSEMVKFLKNVSENYNNKRIKSVMIIGGGRIAYHLATQLVEQNIEVKIIEKNREKSIKLSERLDGVDISCGDGTDPKVLEEEGLSNFDAVVALTGIDEENIILSLYAKKIGVRKVVTKINRLNLLQFSNSFGLDSVVSPKNITLDMILTYIRAKNNSNGNELITLYTLVNDKVEALEFVVRKDTPHINVPLRDLKMKTGVIVAGITRGKQKIVPNGDDCIKINDSVVVITSNKGIDDIEEIFR